MFCSLRSILPGMLATCLVCLATPPGLLADTRTFPQLPDPAHADTEVSTNVVLTSWNRDTRNFHVVLSLDATPSNNVQVAFGRDDSADGNLSDEETALTLGWDCGEWFLASDAAPPAVPNRFAAAPAGSATRRTLAFELRLDVAGSPQTLTLTDGTMALEFPDLDLSAPLPGWLYSRDWDLLKVTVRGTDAKHELVTVKFSGDAVVLLVR